MSVTMQDMGKTNKHWGDCGFTSSFYAMWDLDPGSHAALQLMPKPFTVIEEIRKYLEILKSGGKFSMVQDIEAFCQSFGGPFASFTVDKYCASVKLAASRTESEIMGDVLFSIGMPPLCVKDYLQQVWKFDSTVIDCSVSADDGTDGIVGLCVPQGTLDPGRNVVNTGYNRLVHFMYRRSGIYYSWGDPPYGDLVTAANGGGLACFAGWTVGWLIKIGKKLG